MEPNDLSKCEAAFAEVMALAAEDRLARVKHLAGGDAAFERTLTSLIHAASSSSDLLDAGEVSSVASDQQLGAASMSRVLRAAKRATALQDENETDNECVAGGVIDGYTLVEFLGAGGFGVVYSAFQSAPIRRVVAIKIMRHTHGSRDILARFMRERQALSLLDHPHIARILDAGTTPRGRPYFVMDFVRGVPITTFCDERRLTIADRVALLIQTAEAIDHAHSKGVLHRDIKPQNVLVTVENNQRSVKVIDFGIAASLYTRSLSDENQSDSSQVGRTVSATLPIGTPAYMSPEQTRPASELGERTDIYALGGLLQELLVGAPLFDSATLASQDIRMVLNTIQHQVAITPSEHLRKHDGSRVSLSEIASRRSCSESQLRKRVAGDLEAIILKASAKDPQHRYETALAMSEDLRRFLRGEQVHASSKGSFDAMMKFVRRRRLPVVLGAIILLLGVGSFVAVSILGWHAMKRAKDLERETARANAAAEVAIEREKQAIAARNASIAASYAAEIRSAAAALLAGDVGSMAGTLARCTPELRGWEWHYLHARTDDSVRVVYQTGARLTDMNLSPDGRWVVVCSKAGVVASMSARDDSIVKVHPAHDAEVRRACFSPDGSLVASVGMDGYIKLSQAASGTQVWATRASEQTLDSVAFVRGGQSLVTAGWDGLLRIVDVATGKVTATLPGHKGGIKHIAASPSGELFSSAGEDGDLRIWDAKTGSCLHTLMGFSSGLNVARFSADGSLVAAGSNTGDVGIWEVSSGKLRGRAAVHREFVYSLAFDPSGSRLASVARDRNIAIHWTDGKGEPLVFDGDASSTQAVAWNGTGRVLVTGGSDGTIRAWDSANAKLLGVLRGNESTVEKLIWNEGTQSFFSSSEDGHCREWKFVDHFRPEMFGGHKDQVRVATPSGDGSLLLTCSLDDTARLWDLRTGEQLTLLEGHVWDVLGASFSSDCEKIVTASADSTAIVWDARSGQRLRTFAGHELHVRAARLNSKSTMLATCSNDATARLWSTSTGECLAVLKGHSERVNQVFFVNDDSRVVTASTDCSLRLWDVQSGSVAEVLLGHTKAVVNASLSQDRMRVVSCSEDATARVWSLGADTTSVVLRGHEAGVLSACFFADGIRIATASQDHTARVWDSRTGECLAVLKGHLHQVHCIAVSPDGTRVVTGSRDGTVRLWDSTTGIELLVLATDVRMVFAIHFDAAGESIYAACADHTARVWSVKRTRD